MSSMAASRSALEKANLARIRDNQRRSRARRKEYLQELENKVRQCDLQGIEASAEIQVAARRVADENRKLRMLLHQSGIFDNTIEQHLANTVLPDNSGGGGQTVALLEELLQPRKPVGPVGALPLMGSVLDARGVSRDSSVASISTTQTSVWDAPQQPTTTSGGKRQRSVHNQTHPQSSGSQSGTNMANTVLHVDSHLDPSLSSHPTAQDQPQNISGQSPDVMNSATIDMHDSQIFDTEGFAFDANQSYDPFHPNGLYYKTQFAQFPQSSLSDPNLIQQSMQPPPQTNSTPNHNHNHEINQNEPGYEQTLMNTSSCLFATDMIRTMGGGQEEEVRASLGCSDENDCDVPDDVVYQVIQGRYN